MTKLIVILVLYFVIHNSIKFLKSNPINKTFVKNLDFIFLFRPTTYFIVWLLICIGMYIPHFTNNDIQLFQTFASLDVIFLFLGVSLLGTILIVNNQLNKTNKNYLIKEKFNLLLLDKIKIIFLILSVVCILYSNWILSFLFLFVYFVGEKTHNLNTENPKILFLYHCLICFIFILTGLFFEVSKMNISVNFKMFLVLIPYLLSIISIYLFKESYGNTDLNVKTLSDLFSKQIIALIGFILILFSLIIALFFEDPLASTVLIASIFFYLYALVRGLKKDFIRAIRYSVGIFNFFILMIYPLLLIPVLIVYYISKYYYWHRFNIHYPTFLVDSSTFNPMNITINNKQK